MYGSLLLNYELARPSRRKEVEQADETATKLLNAGLRQLREYLETKAENARRNVKDFATYCGIIIG